jgi:hypothetical protein
MAPPFSNQCIVDHFNSGQKDQQNSAIKSLQQKIMETNFNEPRSLIGGLGSSKKRKIMGLPLNFNKSEKKAPLSSEDHSLLYGMGNGLLARDSMEAIKPIKAVRVDP